MIETTTPQERQDWMRAPARMAWRCVFSGEMDQVRQARRMVEALFAGTGRENDAGLIVSELATNTLLHTRSGHTGGWFGVEVQLPIEGPAYIGVCDLGGAGIPQYKRQQAEQELSVGGLGLAIVKELSMKLSRVGSPETGHTVWVYLELKARDVECAGTVAG
ncbi:ATP-binding protein [Actinomadura sp. ATCC 31491]|uniref:ATP-binding protein n=1 Tax=Actinomadura luzonensis TaxID=2805427 RepID=A0ABT0FPV4_9ACTN|nr:ATP-binding protein [Actinomadura luzonensis]MCK2214035.1 ATP-binding protein [Actinomadura luzonensis]